MSTRGYYYIGLDVHKKSVSFCVMEPDGTVVKEGRVVATRGALTAWAESLPGRWYGGMEATLFSGWVYDHLQGYALRLAVGDPGRLKAITAAKKKSDALDARMLANLLRCHLFPECFMAPSTVRELRRVLRYRNKMVRESTRMKNHISGLLMETGMEYNKKQLHGRRYFARLLEQLELPPSVLNLLRMTRAGLDFFQSRQGYLLAALARDSRLQERMERLREIAGVGQVTALTWMLEIWDPNRFRNRRQAVSYCGLCSAQRESAGKMQRGPLSKKRNGHLQTILIEAAKLAPRYDATLAAVYDRTLASTGRRNLATLAVARKLVGYLLAVDRRWHAEQKRKVAA
ncbi:IS110 family transposase [bacterium]|nr:IS110 family transposase [bacterium]